MAKAKINKEPVEMVSLRDVRVVNTSGHCVHMVANVPQKVPGPLVDTALELGCVPATAAVYEDHKAKLERQMREREQLIEAMIAGIDKLVRTNNLGDFTPTGHPKIDVLAETIDMNPNLITQELRDHAFAEWNTRNRTGRGKRGPKAQAVESTETPAAQSE